MTIAGIVRQLLREKEGAEAQVNRLEAALSALQNLNGSFRGVSPKRRKISAAARRRMAAAQRARRAREKRPILIRAKRRISAAGLARIRAAQRARWAKWKKAA